MCDLAEVECPRCLRIVTAEDMRKTEYGGDLCAVCNKEREKTFTSSAYKYKSWKERKKNDL